VIVVSFGLWAVPIVLKPVAAGGPAVPRPANRRAGKACGNGANDAPAGAEFYRGGALAAPGRITQHMPRSARRSGGFRGAVDGVSAGGFGMKKSLFCWLAAALLLGGVLPAGAQAEEEKVLNVYNWSDYIAADTLQKFTRETGIKVVYDVFDSNETLEAKLLTGHSGYDVVVPSLSFLGRQIKAGVFMPLDKAKLTNSKNLDADLMARIAGNDPGNRYGIPYLMGTTGIGYNVAKVKAALGPDAPVDSWDLIFKPENIAKLSRCGVSMLDTPAEVIPTVLNYLGKPPNGFDVGLVSGEVQDLLLKLRPSVRYFHSSQYINDLANGDICVALGWAGDILQAANRAKEAGNGVQIAYSIPKEGAGLFFDMLAIPAGASHPDNAHRFINFLMRPDVMADITNHVSYANAIPASIPLLRPEIRNNPGIYPAAAVKQRLFTFAVVPTKIDRIYTRVWTKVKTGK
jgi:putrescine transport system substrate-binding protein